jgi:hypothetical protein
MLRQAAVQARALRAAKSHVATTALWAEATAETAEEARVMIHQACMDAGTRRRG